MIKRIFEGDLSVLLEDYFKNFNIVSLEDQYYIYSRYMTLVQDKSLWSVKLEKNERVTKKGEGDIVGSGVICSRHLYWSNSPIKVSFYSQIYIKPEYRGQGYLKYLMEELDACDRNLNSNATIVVARRAVGDLYYKFGFKGFSKFPIISLPQKKVEFNSINGLINFDKLREAYTSTYHGIKGYFARNMAFWEATISSLPANRFDFKHFNINGNYFYVICEYGRVVEIATNNQSAWPRILDFLSAAGVSEYAISLNHPASSFLLSIGGELTVRAEPKEGHMMRLNYYDHLSIKNLEIEDAVNNMSIDVPVLDQW